MNIFYCVHNYNWEDENLYPALVEMGHQVIKYDWGVDAIWRLENWENKGKPRLNEQILRIIKNEHSKKPIDLFFGYLNKYIIYPETIEKIKKLGIPTVNFSCNDAHQFYLVDEIAPFFDWCMITIRSTIDKFKKVGANPIYIQLGANPHKYKPYPLEKEFDLTFVGQRYGDRTDLIIYLAEQGIEVRVWGTGWKDNIRPREQLLAKISYPSLKNALTRCFDGKYMKSLLVRNLDFLQKYLSGNLKKNQALLHRLAGGPLSHEELVQMFSRSKINLGFLTCGETHLAETGRLKQVRLRDFEVTMSGGFYLTEYFDELEDFYIIGKEIVCYHHKEDLVDKIKYYLNHPEEREKIMVAGYQRAQREHTWVKRFEKLFKEIGIKHV